MPVEEELGFDELAFDEEGASDSSQGFGDDSSFSAAEDYSSREPSVSRVEFDDLEALAELVASEPLGTADLGSVSRTDIARENISDARQPNIVITRASVWPDLGWFDWIFQILGVRKSVIEGTWGFPPETTGETAN